MNTEPKNSRISEGLQAHPEQALQSTNPQSMELPQPNSKTKAAFNPWDAAKEIEVLRASGAYPLADLEPGVKFFVLMLEQLGATTLYSCEGHPEGFYIVFFAPYEIALRISNCGYFTVEIESSGTWSIRIPEASEPRSEADKAELLRRAARNWQHQFGPLAALDSKRHHNQTSTHPQLYNVRLVLDQRFWAFVSIEAVSLEEARQKASSLPIRNVEGWVHLKSQVVPDFSSVAKGGSN